MTIQESEDMFQEAEKVCGPQNMMKRGMMEQKDSLLQRESPHNRCGVGPYSDGA